jgi:hypothetical protein
MFRCFINAVMFFFSSEFYWVFCLLKFNCIYICFLVIVNCKIPNYMVSLKFDIVVYAPYIVCMWARACVTVFVMLLFIFGFHDFWVISIMFSIILITSDFGILVYIFSMSNEHILISSLISMACKSAVRCIEF